MGVGKLTGHGGDDFPHLQFVKDSGLSCVVEPQDEDAHFFIPHDAVDQL